MRGKRGHCQWGLAFGTGVLLLSLGCRIAASPASTGPNASPTPRATSPISGAGSSPALPPPTPRGLTPTLQIVSTMGPTPTRPAAPPTSAVVRPAVSPTIAVPSPSRPPAPPFAAVSPSPVAQATSSPAGRPLVVHGQLQRVAASARVLLVAVDGQGEQEISLAADASVRRADGRPAQLGDLRPGDRLELAARRTAAGALVADRVTIVASAAR